MKKLILVMILGLATGAFAQSFTTAPSSNPCATILTVDGQQPTGNWYRCFQTTSFNSAPGFSLYLPGLTLEGCSVAYGPHVLQLNGTYLQQSVASCYGYSVTIANSYGQRCTTTRSRYGTHTLCSYYDLGGSGTVTVQ